MSDELLRVEKVSMHFGGLCAVDQFSLHLKEQDLVGLIGPNGAGKTTLFNMMTGVYVPSCGDIFLGSQSLKGLKAAQIASRGVARTFQNIRLFKDLSVLDNIRIAAHLRVRYSLWQGLIRHTLFKKEEEEQTKQARELAQVFGLDHLQDQLAKNLSYGQQRRLEIARALMTRPKLLFLDEPAAGMNQVETSELTSLIRWLRDEFKIAILLIEHDMKLVMNLCERLYVMDHGVEIAQGSPSQIQQNPQVIKAYLGSEL